MRLDGALQVSPASVKLRGEGLELRAWQQKTDRARRGTCYVICLASLSKKDLLESGMEV